MQKILFAFCLLVAFASCRKENTTYLSSTDTVNKATMSFDTFKISFGRFIAGYDYNKLGVLLIDTNEEGLNVLSIYQSGLDLKLGKQYLGTPTYKIEAHPAPFGTFYTSHGDMPGDAYFPNPHDPSKTYIEFTEINKERGTLKGIFHGEYLRDTSREIFYRDVPDTVRITDGVFDLKRVKL